MSGGAVVEGVFWKAMWGALICGVGVAACSSDAPPGAASASGNGGADPSGVAGSSSKAGSPETQAGSDAGAGDVSASGGFVSSGGGDDGPDCGDTAQKCCPGYACNAGLSCRGGSCVALPVDDFGKLCQLDVECLGGLCVPDADNHYRCSAACSADDDCLAGWTCADSDAPAPKACHCQPVAETCNGLDDDCNGVVDDAPATKSECIAGIGDGGVCKDGECGCGGLMCDVLCVDEQTDPNNCGACDVRCDLGCQLGECLIPTAVSVAGGRACALLSDQTVRCWGRNQGLLGDGTLQARENPTPLELSRVTELDLSANNGCAVTSEHSLRCWGNGAFGMLGIGTAQGGRIPTLVPGVPGVEHVGLGESHTCASGMGGEVWCWGNNQQGEVGFQGGIGSRQLTPVVVSGVQNAIKLALGHHHTCALLSGGTVSCWGGNTMGQLGDGTKDNRFTPQEIPGLSGVRDLAAGLEHSCALLEGGVVKCWGNGTLGQIGDQANADRTEPTLVPNLTASAIEAGGYATVARSTDNPYYGWGDGFLVKSSFPKSLLDFGTTGRAYGLDGDAGCVLGDAGQLGDFSDRCFNLVNLEETAVVW